MTPHTILWMPSTHTFNSMLRMVMVVLAMEAMVMMVYSWMFLTTWWPRS